MWGFEKERRMDAEKRLVFFSLLFIDIEIGLYLQSYSMYTLRGWYFINPRKKKRKKTLFQHVGCTKAKLQIGARKRKSLFPKVTRRRRLI